MCVDVDEKGPGVIPREERGPVLNGLPTTLPDVDPEETQEWIESLDKMVEIDGPNRARIVLLKMLERARSHGRLGLSALTSTDYINTIAAEDEEEYPGDAEIERNIRRLLRWNSAVTVHRAQRPGIGVGGHISTYASAVTLYEVGQNHFWRGQDAPGGGDQVFFQGHAAPGMYARAFLEGRLSEDDLDGFRQEKSKAGHGLPSYPHPRMLPHFWQFPTVSMGLGPMDAIYQASMNKYLTNRGIKDCSDQHVWAFLGDGEMDEPESRGFLQVAANEELDNLTFVINCNLQRLDGPVRGNGKIVQELEAVFRGAGWNVIKVIWGSGWDPLLQADRDGALVDIMNSTRDGDYQTFKANDGAYVREYFFGRDPRTAKMVENWTDEQIWALRRGGHDYRKIYNAYKAAMEFKGAPTVVLACTIKGYDLGTHFAGRNATHQMKKLALDDLKQFRDRLEIPISDKVLEADPYRAPYFHPGADDERVQYLVERRHALGGFVPERRTKYTPLPIPGQKAFDGVKRGSGKQEVATTMAFVRLLKDLMRDKNFAPHVVPIIPDEARTFGMDSFFPTIKIYNPHGQNYTPVDHELMLSYREAKNGQIIHTGINEAGSAATFIAAGSAYSTQGVPMVPIYLFYSMFGFQRTGDSFWAAGDQMTRGFIIGATAGRTTLTGEGTQHMDGHSPVLAASNPAVISYDPAYSYEISHIVQAGLEHMYGENAEDVMYYLTVYNEPIIQPAEPEGVDVEGIVKGMYLLSKGSFEGVGEDARCVQLMASGVAVPWALEAQQLLKDDFGVVADVWSVTSWNNLRRDAMEAEEQAFLHPEQGKRTPYIVERLAETSGPVVAATDYMRQVSDQIAQWVPGDYASLGADGFGFSDTRAAARRFFHIDGPSMAVRALQMLVERGEVPQDWPTKAAEKYDLLNVNAGASGNAGGDA
ncbi:pyruvate dehydrogenase (acetyl-transferring), homodimeric type [Propionibacterium sp. NM47_B9-13]|uniref:pyruvate dehydrogenase (acetyl-transferring), homodimeric type n=1 Tax=Cutibacterium modestum TaxID=2559073 RepID=UPI0001EF2E10|nr:pyruvate dehydrogenase (acetyl-transferring), homodimeric type [Cutibacterium modestum]TGY29437.1 pyruvate dehydrogenase (acetyl-transferring), homodimeric type [Propionibacterium sp. NM47_B9-13]AOH44796.1 pyruvate dehydrogenase (acetyl-transferring), homodimeric type [Cutibacterium modestum]EFS74913.1 pyruvate dehydrogenase (acetyl-transferring), homodimeric type [Cutibacterium modestum HL037PA2]EFT16069.1 pyruvate dehydrogenase (acetyl-transferring), homodimeric type [Cutibacterium modestu